MTMAFVPEPSATIAPALQGGGIPPFLIDGHQAAHPSGTICVQGIPNLCSFAAITAEVKRGELRKFYIK
jgi:hypothetical protein